MKQAHSQRGMSLIEAMSSMAILAVGVSGAIGITVNSARSISRGAHVEEATMLAQSLVSTLMSVPWNARGSSAASLFANTTMANDTDITDGAGVFARPATPTASNYDHIETEITGTPIAALVTPLPTGRTTYERYWNIAPIAGTAGVSIAVIVRWHENSNWSRVVLVGTRYQP
jgi:prepilin-type N-terminal cleavage/methylation domain-containing protein